MDRQQQALVALGRRLLSDGYRFTTVTPETHRRVLARDEAPVATITTRVFGWSMPFACQELDAAVVADLDTAGVLEATGDGQLRSAVRFSTVGELLLCHSSYPTNDEHAVFFGPDTYRFIRAIDAALCGYPGFAPNRIVDVGAGTGAGGLHCARRFPDARVILTDVNAAALRIAEVNAAINECANAEFHCTDLMNGLGGDVDFVTFNPPYLVDTMARTYRHGGGEFGCELAVRFLREAIPQLRRQGKLLLYTGAPIVGGQDKFFEEAASVLSTLTSAYEYEEIDPDVFGEELDRPPYRSADRIAVVSLSIDGEDIQQ
jgi:SAM-dependent methyltransferase